MGLTSNVIGGTCSFWVMITHMTFPSTTIDITNRTTFDIGIGTGRKGLGLVVILHGTTGSAGIDILCNSTT